jgi:D-3-phosphoglycerate dehydrogenase
MADTDVVPVSELSLAKDRIRILLLEGIHPSAVETYAAAGYRNVERLTTALDPQELEERVADVHVLGIRSRTRVTVEVLAAAPKLFCVGCFCIGTNQVDLEAAKLAGIPVFNAPYSNTRSVAELVVGEIIMLFRGVHQRSFRAHAGMWAKSVEGSSEIRGKALGIVGYGHIGSQLSVLAEAMGMQIHYYDIVDKLSLGNARSCASLGELLAVADVVSLHVPATPETVNMIGAGEVRAMRPGSYLVNASRGNVVDLEALADAVRGGHIAGAAIDVYPTEPSSRDEPLETPLRGLDQVILTPHIGGSTREAQESIGSEVADKLIRYSDTGATLGAVNFVELSLPVQVDTTRFLHVHRNVPGVLAHINGVFSGRGLNIAGQYLRTDGEIGYVVVDVSGRVTDSGAIRDELLAVEGTLRVRFLY